MHLSQLTAPDSAPTACIWCLLVVAGGNGLEKFNLLKSKKKLFVFFGFRGFRSGRQGDGVSANFTTSALKTNR
jgi:hypothetical protein